MKLAFWKVKPDPRRAGKRTTTVRDDRAGLSGKDLDEVSSEAERLRQRSRRRLIGSAALLLAAIIVVPMVLDTTPQSVPEDIPIDLPSDRSAFVPKPEVNSAPAGAAAEASGQTAAGTVAAVPNASTAEATPAAPESVPDSAGDDAQVAAKTTATHSAGHASTGKPDSSAHKAHFTVQAASLGSDKSAHDLQDRLQRLGLKAYIERSKTESGVHYRVRLGPYGSREEAGKIRQQLSALSLHADLIEVP